MPVTRSASRSATNVPLKTAASTVAAAKSTESAAAGKNKRKAPSESKQSSKVKKPRKEEPSGPISNSNGIFAPSMPVVSAAVPEEPEVFVPAVLTFSFEEAKRHLINMDGRFEDLFDRLKCKPFEHLEQVHPFRALAQSILGQQISWKAARSITHKFVRLYDPSLPETLTDFTESKSHTSFFPSPQQVASTDTATLRTAGLSMRKAEYVQDLAARFADGRLSTQKLLEADDQELAEMLIEVRGIGRWTVDMFAIFSLRRPNILPVGDLGVQRGMLRWFLALHSSSHSYIISPDKIQKSNTSNGDNKANNASEDEDTLPVLNPIVRESSQNGVDPSEISSILPVPRALSTEPKEEADEGLPVPFTPSINKTLNNVRKATATTTAPMALPEGLTVADLKSRLQGKKKAKGIFLTPAEMEGLTASWQPYRSLGVYYMWALAEEKS